MPTPSSNPPPELPSRSHSSSCPDDTRSTRATGWGLEDDGTNPVADDMAPTSDRIIAASEDSPGTISDDMRSATDSPRPDSRAGSTPGSTPDHEPSQQGRETDGDEDPSQSQKALEAGEQQASSSGSGSGSSRLLRVDAPTALTSRQRHDGDEDTHADNDKTDDASMPCRTHEDSLAPLMGYDYSNKRIPPISPSTFLRPGAKFQGTQQSERQVYEVQVEIKYVDLRESYLCGYLKIQGLTEDNPTLTTFFEGEIIGSKYGFITKHEGWGATEKIDLNHWGKFSAFRQYKSLVRKGANVTIPNLAQRENIFMRWKEHFLVPDHRVRTINGASFEGFYYICFNMREGSVSGIYFHSKSEKFQQLELKHQDDRGCFGSLEFR